MILAKVLEMTDRAGPPPIARALAALLSPPSAEDAARILYPSLRALLGPQMAAAGAPMPNTYDDVPAADRARFVEFVRPILASAFGGGSQ